MADFKQLKRPANYQNCIASRLVKGESFEYFTTVNYLSFLLEGTIQIEINEHVTILNSPSMFIVPKESHYKRVSLQPSTMITFPIAGEALNLSLLSINKEKVVHASRKEGLSILGLGELFQKLLHLFADSFSFSLLDENYYELKLTELFYLIKSQYTEYERTCFFAPIIDEDFLFSNFIMDNYKQTANIKELVELSYYSMSSFDKKFRRIFGQTPSKWLNERKKENIYKELFDTDKTLKQISIEHGFCSPVYFNAYCKSVFGMSPGEIRKKELELNVR